MVLGLYLVNWRSIIVEAFVDRELKLSAEIGAVVHVQRGKALAQQSSNASGVSWLSSDLVRPASPGRVRARNLLMSLVPPDFHRHHLLLIRGGVCMLAAEALIYLFELTHVPAHSIATLCSSAITEPSTMICCLPAYD